MSRYSLHWLQYKNNNSRDIKSAVVSSAVPIQWRQQFNNNNTKLTVSTIIPKIFIGEGLTPRPLRPEEEGRTRCNDQCCLWFGQRSTLAWHLDSYVDFYVVVLHRSSSWLFRRSRNHTGFRIGRNRSGFTKFLEFRAGINTLDANVECRFCIGIQYQTEQWPEPEQSWTR